MKDIVMASVFVLVVGSCWLGWTIDSRGADLDVGDHATDFTLLEFGTENRVPLLYESVTPRPPVSLRLPSDFWSFSFGNDAGQAADRRLLQATFPFRSFLVLLRWPNLLPELHR